MHIFYLFFARFMQFPVLDFGLDHSGSRPFIDVPEQKLNKLHVIHLSVAQCSMFKWKQRLTLLYWWGRAFHNSMVCRKNENWQAL